MLLNIYTQKLQPPNEGLAPIRTLHQSRFGQLWTTQCEGHSLAAVLEEATPRVTRLYKKTHSFRLLNGIGTCMLPIIIEAQVTKIEHIYSGGDQD